MEQMKMTLILSPSFEVVRICGLASTIAVIESPLLY